jgi:hypothetical protein
MRKTRFRHFIFHGIKEAESEKQMKEKLSGMTAYNQVIFVTCNSLSNFFKLVSFKNVRIILVHSQEYSNCKWCWLTSIRSS